MKRSTIVMFCLLPFLACSSGQTENNNKKEKETYQAAAREDYVEHYANGIKKIEGQKINGERHGKWIYYYKNGMLWSEGMYRHGERDGSAIVYYENGNKKIEGQYENGLRVGKWKIWEADGSLVKVIDLDSMLTAKDSAKLGM